ncbi:MAG: alanine--tRNA ligase [Peptostreptococcaceae bacterium]|nr:alanine--tRNA ligase [Peptostreptococcaceae bacterium]
MKYMGVNELRQAFKDFFERRGHLARKSFSLVPENDKSLLLINAGMAPMKNYFVGLETPPSKRMVTCQKCMRTGDIENVGKTARHATFFEMLGNFSFGDYFKKDATAWAWEFVTVDLGLPKEKLWVSVYEEDDEAEQLWEKQVGVPKERIVRLGKADNFWEIGNGTGPCGPCSEIYIDRGEQFGCGCEDCKPGCECDRFLELWNLVFTQFDRDTEGNYNPLKHPNIDTGMGLERIACIMQGVDSIFDVDTMKNIRDHVCRLAQKVYNQDAMQDVSIRVITDHLRAVTFLIADGVIPSNEGRGYVLRRILRRAARHGRLLGVQEGFLTELIDSVIENYREAYDELPEKQAYIKKIVGVEEAKFAETLEQGLSILLAHIEEMKEQKSTVLAGDKAFRLYDTYGFPVELTLEILQESGMSVDEAGFEAEMKQQRERARSARVQQGNEGWNEENSMELKGGKTDFQGYESLNTEGRITDILADGLVADVLRKGDKGILVFDRTTFYGESGGQTGDRGELRKEGFAAKVVDVRKTPSGQFLHHVEVLEGEIRKGESVQMLVEEEIRNATRKNHTATHLLHKALKEVVGAHITQAGSLVSDKRLRFDFHHFEALSAEQIAEMERLVNRKIAACIPVTTKRMELDEAKASGAVALFDEKYDDIVRVVSVGDFSTELCGGTHVSNSAEIGIFKILSESGVAAGVRRIEALTGQNVYDYLTEKEKLMAEAKQLLKTNDDNFIPRLQSVVEEAKRSAKELQQLKSEMARGKTEDLLHNLTEIGEVRYLPAILENLDDETLRNMAESLLDKAENAVVMLCGKSADKLSFICMVSKGALEKGVHAGKFIKEVASLTGGGGGGRPNMAQAGGKDPSKAETAMQQSVEILKKMIL